MPRTGSEHGIAWMKVTHRPARNYASMNVSLTPDLEELVKRKVDSGAYRSATDVVRDALELLEERDARKLDALRKGIQHAVDQIEGGEFTEYETDRLNELFEKVVTEGRNTNLYRPGFSTR